MMTLLPYLLMNVLAFWLSFAGSFGYAFCATNRVNPSEFCAAYVESYDAAWRKK